MQQFTYNEQLIEFDKNLFENQDLELWSKIDESVKNELFNQSTENVIETLKNDYGYNVVEVQVPIELTSLATSTINVSDLGVEISKHGLTENFTEYFSTSDFKILNNESDFLRLKLSNSTAPISIKIIGENLENLVEKLSKPIQEDFGVQGPEAVHGMGSVKMPEVNGSSVMPTYDGSGDIPGTGTIVTNSNPLLNDDDEDKLNEQSNIGQLDVHFTAEDVKNMTDLEFAINKVTIRKCKKIDTEFSCSTLEGITHGKAGDYLVVGVDGEVYPCHADIFHKTYTISANEDEATTENLDNATPDNIENAYLVIQESFEQIDEGGLFDIMKSMKHGDLIEIVSSIVNTEDFAKSAVKREVVNQLNKRGLLPNSVAKLADKFFKYTPIFNKIF